jgi:hypothetical protein
VDATDWTAVFTAVAAIAAVVYVELTRRLWRESAKQREANLMLTLMVEYDNLRDSVRFVQDWFMESAASGVDAIERFRDEMGVDHSTPRAATLDDHRFRVSRFFVKTRKLVSADYLTEKMVAEALGGQAIEDVFLKLVDPLDAAKAGHNYGVTDRQFYTALLSKYPRPKTASL